MKFSHVIVAIAFFILGAICAVVFAGRQEFSFAKPGVPKVGFITEPKNPGAAPQERGTSWWVFGATSSGKTFHTEGHTGAPPPVTVTFKFERDINRQGADYSDFSMAKRANSSVCELACEIDKKCKAFTFVKAGPRGAVPHCWLKNAVPQAYKDDQCISGVKE